MSSDRPATDTPHGATETPHGVTETPRREADTPRADPPWLAHDRAMALAIFAVALGLRLLHLREIAIHDPFFTIPSVDGAVYDAWARRIVAGDWLGEGVLFLGPLYPFIMAGVYAVFGESLPALKAVQAVLGALTCVLVWGLARELFGRRVALLAGALAAFHRMLVFYGGTVMIVNVQVPLVVGGVWAALVAFRRPGLARFALCGLLVGLSVLARQTMLLVAPILLIWIFVGLAERAPLARRAAFAGVFATAIAACILPFTFRNLVVGGDFVLLNASGGPNFYMGNRRGTDGTWQLPDLGVGVRVDNPEEMQRSFTRVAEQEAGRALRPSEVSSHWLRRGLAEIAADPGRWVGVEMRKLALFWNAYEVWNNRSVDVSARFSWVLQGPLVRFGLVAPFALLGLFLTRARWRELVPVHAALAAYLATALLFFVLSRYRMPATILLLPFAAYAMLEALARLRARDARALLAGAAALIALAVFVHWPFASENRMHMAFYNLGNKYRELERWDEAVEAYRASLAENPRAISTHNNLAVTLELAGRREEAIEAWKVVGVMAMRTGDRRRMERAARHLRELGIPVPEGPAPGSAEDEK